MGKTDWFDEKASQVNSGSLTAFGIRIDSRYDKASELVEMLRFCEGIAELGHEGLISTVFYDSKANICSFETAAGARITPNENAAMLLVALDTISQFFWLDDRVHHGNGVGD